MPAVAQVLDQFARAPQWLHLLDRAQVERGFGRADRIAVARVDLLAEERGDQLVPPMPMWRWIVQMGTTCPCWRIARNQATAWW